MEIYNKCAIVPVQEDEDASEKVGGLKDKAEDTFDENKEKAKGLIDKNNRGLNK